MTKYIIALVASAIIFVAAVIGWVLNIATIAHMTPVLTGMGILRVVGIFVAPLGAVLGYF